MKLSIIIPVHNLEEYLEEMFNSLCDMSFSYDYELIVINDGSTDNSESIIKHYCEVLNIRLINIENNGVSYARNIGLKYAEGDYISFVDGDDIIEPLFFERAVLELDSDDYDFVQVNYNTIDGSSISKIQCVEMDRTITDQKEMLDCFFGNQKVIHNSVWGKVYRFSSVKSLLFDSCIHIAEDEKFVFQVLLRSRKIKLLHYFGYNYVVRHSSVMHTFNLSKRYEAVNVLKYCKANVEYENIKNSIDKRIVELLLDLYDSALIYGIRSSEIYCELVQLKKQNASGLLSRKQRIKFNFLLSIPSLYDFVLISKNRSIFLALKNGENSDD